MKTMDYIYINIYIVHIPYNVFIVAKAQTYTCTIIGIHVPHR